MNLKHITLLFLAIVGLFVSCNDSENEYSTDGYNDAQIASLVLTGVHNKTLDSLSRATDSLRYIVLGKTKFAIDQVAGVIYNPDSLPYGMKLGKLNMALTYSSTISALNIELPDSTYVWNYSDSVDFSKRPIYLESVAPSITSKKRYRLDVRIHQIDPDVLAWRNVGDFTDLGTRKTVLFNDKFYSFVEKPGAVALDIATVSPTSATSLSITSHSTNLPSNTNIRNIVSYNDAFYAVTADGKSYKSLDGQVWNEQANGKVVAVIYGVLPSKQTSDDLLLVLVQDAGKYYFAKTKDFSSVDVLTEIPSGFPVYGFASATNSKRDRAIDNVLLLTAGEDNSGIALSATWILRYADGKLEYTKTNTTTLFGGVGLVTTFYNNKVYLFVQDEIYTSNTWGMEWAAVDDKEKLPSGFTMRRYESLVVRNNYLWVFAGESSIGNPYRDIWTGILNKLR